ncbi:MAG: tRNA dihydrouridine(20/20a) synthase DusA [Micavibrio sp. TMED27]|nr:tRNA dihydrouridine(20/20a) synthase DusA [Micavibrio sp.]OUT92008.1 MAG: tRNA dihydrouridine(20/20a) synthase DusA [Micavibrio sp. TMED27]|tara:strand:+ start:1312 stop:2298 length:987 start_codon:yes stop_codon:yes gene_type:complete
MSTKPDISVAPMMDWTDRHCRYFHRLISPNTRLYTEMITTGALLHGDRERFLRYNQSEHPLAIQLGGSDPNDLAHCAELAEKQGYDEVNLNCGCPSDRVQKGKIGAILMTEPELVAQCFAEMQKAVNIPVTIKCRIGIDEEDQEEFLFRFVDKIGDKGCTTFIIHARKAWLHGLSPKQNREVPPLMYERVHNVKKRYPQMRIIINGGLKTIQDIQAHIPDLDGAMIGREAYSNPYLLADIEKQILNGADAPSREKIAQKMIQYAKEQAQEYGTPIKSITRHILGLYHGQKGAKQWKRTLSTLPYQKDANEQVIEAAIEAVAAHLQQGA